jgi:uncharacterized protein
VMQMALLTVQLARRDGLHAEFGQEAGLTRFAASKNKHVLSLETPAQQFAALMPAAGDDPLPSLERALAQLEADRAGPLMRRLVSAWERGDEAELAAYASWCDCIKDAQDRRTMARVIDERNVRMAQRIDELHQRDLKVFAAVGALHMTGEMALQTLLQARGFQLERVAMLR